mmetsp:Transcript_12837/g.19791  ORF Transcript_12837/g.19791 Transcript_12837/m.19791 type:complete len:591 (+) Transcript_12837:67-1839(+)
MPRLIREESQEVTAAPLPTQQTAAAVGPDQKKAIPTLHTKNEKRKHSPVHHGINQGSSTTQKKKTKAPKKEKDPNAPKKPRSTYILYTMHARPKITATGAVATGEVLGEQWRAMSAAEKLQYEQMAIDDRKRYAKEKAMYDAKNKSLAESDKQEVGGGGATVSLSHPMKLEQKKSAITHARGVENVTDDKKMEHAKLLEVVNTDEVSIKKEANASNKDVQPPSQKSPESVEVDLFVDSRESCELSRKEENDEPADNGNKENNNAPCSKVGKGLTGLGKSIAKAKSGVTRPLNSKKKSQEEENPSKPQVVVRAGSYTVVVKTNECREVPLNNAKVDGEVDLGGDSGEGSSGSMKVRDQKNDLQRSVERKLKDDTTNVDPMQAGTAQLRLNSSNDDENEDTCSQQSADLLSECSEDGGTPIASNTSKKSPNKTKARTSSSDPPQAPANLAKLTIIPLNRYECVSALNKLKGRPNEQPDYLALVPEKDQTTVRKTITLEEKDAVNSVALDEVVLGRSGVTGIKSTLISRQLCTLEMKGKSASITMLKESEQHAIFLNGEPLEGPVGKEFELNDLDILSLYGPVDFAYRVQLSS